MHMAFRKILILLLPLVMIRCAQVGQISGGDKDEFAPRPIEGKTNPPNESVYFQGNSFEMTFEEFIQLNNPQQTLFIVPNHVKPKASIHKKTLKVEWDEKLQDNTTYVVYMNGTVKDVTENNDSLLSYVFSTGNTIDSLRYTCTVRDAWTNDFVKDATVGLFTSEDSIKPYYFSKVNRFGLAQFDYLKAGTYSLKAFVDENKDMQIQPSEKMAFRSETIQLERSIIDSVPLRLFSPTEKAKITSYKYQAPASFLVGANCSIKEAVFSINNQEIDTSNIRFIDEDSVQLFMQVKNFSTFDLIVKSDELSDTNTVRLTDKEKTTSLPLFSAFTLQNLGPHEALSFFVNDLIEHIDSSKFKLTDPSDSSLVPFTVNFSQSQFVLNLDRKQHEQLNLVLQKGALQTKQGFYSDSATFTIQLKDEKDFGLINLDVSAFEEQIIVDLLQKDKLVKSVVLNDAKKHTFPFLSPGEYSFRVIIDRDKNGQWNTGNSSSSQQPEEVLWFSTPTKVRANWDIDVNLTPTQ